MPFSKVCHLASALEDAARAIVTLSPVTLAHVFNADFRAGTRGMDEMIVAEVNANMRESMAHRVEEYEIAGF